MKQYNRWLMVILSIVLLPLAACIQMPANAAGKSIGSAEEPARIDRIEGTELSRVTLSAEAAQRLGIQTTVIRDEKVGGTTRKVVPYAAVIYGLHGETWVYTSPGALTFVRDRINVDSVENDQAILSNGPPLGTEIVTVGAPELYGAEFEEGIVP
jgi:hypothetical protein